MFFIKILGVLAILGALCFGGQITLQVLEMQEYKTPPSLWPPK